MSEELLALAARCEAATRPSLLLERDIAIAIYVDAWPIAGNEARVSVWDGNGRTQLTVKPYTTSLDAAMTLVPEGHTVQMSDWDHEILRAKGPWQAIVLPMGARGSMQQFTFSNRCDHAQTAALALTAAALRARAATPILEGEASALPCPTSTGDV